MRKIFYKIPLLKKIVWQRDELLKKVFTLESEKNRLFEENEKNKPFKDIFLSPWTDAWKDFNVRNFDKIPELMEDLKFGMDEKSRKNVEIFWEKIIYLIPYNRYKKSFLYKTDVFFTQEELADQKKETDLSKYKFPNEVNIEASVFSIKSGLIFLPNGIVAKIRGKAIIDGGAYFGDSALSFCEYDPSEIYAFEPIDSIYQKLKETIRINNLEEIINPIKFGLSNARKKEAIIYGTNSGASLIDSKEEGSQKIETITIDQFVGDKNVDVGLIKLDVEGSELDVIKGSLETIKKHKPILLISVYHRPEDFFFIKPMIEKLELGYRFMIRKTSPFRVTSETVLIGYTE